MTHTTAILLVLFALEIFYGGVMPRIRDYTQNAPALRIKKKMSGVIARRCIRESRPVFLRIPSGSQNY